MFEDWMSSWSGNSLLLYNNNSHTHTHTHTHTRTHTHTLSLSLSLSLYLSIYLSIYQKFSTINNTVFLSGTLPFLSTSECLRNNHCIALIESRFFPKYISIMNARCSLFHAMMANYYLCSGSFRSGRSFCYILHKRIQIYLLSFY